MTDASTECEAISGLQSNSQDETAAKKRICFLDLSGELRNNVYDFIGGPPELVRQGPFCIRGAVSLVSTGLGCQAPLSPIAHLCRQVRHEYVSRKIEKLRGVAARTFKDAESFFLLQEPKIMEMTNTLHIGSISRLTQVTDRLTPSYYRYKETTRKRERPYISFRGFFCGSSSTDSFVQFFLVNNKVKLSREFVERIQSAIVEKFEAGQNNLKDFLELGVRLEDEINRNHAVLLIRDQDWHTRQFSMRRWQEGEVDANGEDEATDEGDTSDEEIYVTRKVMLASGCHAGLSVRTASPTIIQDGIDFVTLGTEQAEDRSWDVIWPSSIADASARENKFATKGLS